MPSILLNRVERRQRRIARCRVRTANACWMAENSHYFLVFINLGHPSVMFSLAYRVSHNNY
jgi:hypothetical protein